MSRHLWLAILCGLLVRPVLAAGQLNVTANAEARVSLDGQPVGQTPTRITEVPPGFHQLQVQCVATGETFVYDLYSPQSASLVREVPVQFQNVPTAAVVPAPDAPPPPPPPGTAVVTPEDESREKKHVRNSLLGAALLNEVFNRGHSKKVVRGVTLGGALINQIVNH